MSKNKRSKTAVNLKLHQVCISNDKCRRIPHSPNSLNTMHWAEKARWKKAWEEEVGYAWLECRRNYPEAIRHMPYKNSKCQIFIFSIRAQDDDNRFASVKGIVDGLAKAGLIVNDDPGKFFLDVIPVKVGTKEAEHVEIFLKLKT